MSKPTDLYAALSPAARLVAQAYGVVAPHPMGVARTTKVMANAGVRLLGRRVTEAEIRRCNQEIIDAGIGFKPVRPANSGVCAARHWAVLLTSEAQREGRLEPILSAFEVTRTGPRSDPYMYETLFRCYVVDGDFENLDELIGSERFVDDWRFLAEPLATDILARLPRRHIDQALAGCLREVIETASPAEPVIAAWPRASLAGPRCTSRTSPSSVSSRGASRQPRTCLPPCRRPSATSNRRRRVWPRRARSSRCYAATTPPRDATSTSAFKRREPGPGGAMCSRIFRRSRCPCCRWYASIPRSPMPCSRNCCAPRNDRHCSTVTKSAWSSMRCARNAAKRCICDWRCSPASTSWPMGCARAGWV